MPLDNCILLLHSYEGTLSVCTALLLGFGFWDSCINVSNSDSSGSRSLTSEVKQFCQLEIEQSVAHILLCSQKFCMTIKELPVKWDSHFSFLITVRLSHQVLFFPISVPQTLSVFLVCLRIFNLLPSSILGRDSVPFNSTGLMRSSLNFHDLLQHRRSILCAGGDKIIEVTKHWASLLSVRTIPFLSCSIKEN